MFIPFAIFSALEAPDERAALLAYKTTVAFPTRLSTPGFLSQGVALGEYEQNADPVTNAVAAGAASAQPAPSTAQVLAKPSSEEFTTAADAKQAESVTTPAAETATEKDATIPTSADVEASKSEVTPKDDEDTSSSSSSSDSDSDSDSDDEKPDKTELAEPVVHAEDKAGLDEKPSAVSEEHASDVKTRAVPEHVEPSVPERAPKGAVKGAPQEAEVVSEPKFKKVPDPCTASAPSEDIVDPAPVLCTAASVKAQANVIPESETGVEVKSSVVSGGIPKPVTKSAPDVSAEPTPEVVLDSATKVASEPEPEIKTAPKTLKAVAADEELVDTAPAITDAEEVRADPDVSAAPEGTHHITFKFLFTPLSRLLTTQTHFCLSLFGKYKHSANGPN